MTGTPQPFPDADVRGNLVWSALTGPQRHLATFSASGGAARFDEDVSIFCAVEHPHAPDWDGLAEVAQAAGYVLLAGAERIDPAPGWKSLFDETVTQYVAADLEAAPTLPTGLSLQPLDETHDAAMAELTALTEPGPWSPRTRLMGRYTGVFDGDQLVAMAGERLRAPGWSEVSAVCTHPSAQRRGLGALLTLHVAAEIRASEAEALLHVRAGNDIAHRLYQRIGFRVAGDMHFTVLAPGD